MAVDVLEDRQLLFEKLLELMKLFDSFCKKHDIKYYACGGTLLGSVRHKGFIPWDDDVDIAVPRADYNRMKAIMEKEPLPEPFFFQTPKTDKGYPKGFARIRNSNTTEIPYDDVAMKCNRGVFIDIFPLDNIPDDEKKFQKQIKQMQRARLFMNCYARYNSGFGAEYTTTVKKIAYYMMVPLFKMRLLTMSKLYANFEKAASRYSNVKTKRQSIIACIYYNPRFIYSVKDHSDKVDGVFEDMIIPLPVGYESILRNAYGDYMTPVKAPSQHGDLVFSATVPYEKYIEEHFDELKAHWIKQTETGR